MLQTPETFRLAVTDKAVEKIKEFMAKDGKDKPNLALRLYIAGGGCSGFRYGMAFDDKTNGDDRVVESNGVKLVVDAESARMIDGSEIDYVENVMGSGFMVNNPNATETCGCGQSFKGH